MENPNYIVPTPPAGDSSFRVANTQFVGTAVASAIANLPFAVGSTQNDFISGGVAAPANQDYRIVEYVPFPMTLTQMVAKVSTGTVTAILKINATSLVTFAALGTTQTTATISASNTATTGDVIIVTINGTASAPANLSFMVKFTRSLS